MKGFSRVALILAVLVLVLAALFVPIRKACAAEPGGAPPSGFCEFLANGWNAPSVAAGLAAIISFVIEVFPAFQEWPAKKKQGVYLGICLAIGFGAWGASLAAGCLGLPDWWTVLVAVWDGFRSGIVAFGAGTAIHLAYAALKPTPLKV